MTERDRPLLSGEGLTSFTWTGEADVLRARLDATAAAGTTEILYAPIGPDVHFLPPGPYPMPQIFLYWSR